MVAVPATVSHILLAKNLRISKTILSRTDSYIPAMPAPLIGVGMLVETALQKTAIPVDASQNAYFPFRKAKPIIPTTLPENTQYPFRVFSGIVTDICLLNLSR